MFTGLIEEVGTVAALHRNDAGCQLRLSAPRLSAGLEVGESVAVNGCCLTVTARDRAQITFDLLNETLDRTNLGTLRADSVVNLERAIRADSRLGGHFIQGHVDCTAPIVDLAQHGNDRRLEIELPAAFSRYVVLKGSIAVNGISLTVAEILPRSFVVWIIPHTVANTNLAQAKPGELVNLEFDLLAKYVERILQAPSSRP